jgi:hypothetical protein
MNEKFFPPNLSPYIQQNSSNKSNPAHTKQKFASLLFSDFQMIPAIETVKLLGAVELRFPGIGFVLEGG